jgi:hypothetical protein
VIPGGRTVAACAAHLARNSECSAAFTIANRFSPPNTTRVSELPANVEPQEPVQMHSAVVGTAVDDERFYYELSADEDWVDDERFYYELSDDEVPRKPVKIHSAVVDTAVDAEQFYNELSAAAEDCESSDDEVPELQEGVSEREADEADAEEF